MPTVAETADRTAYDALISDHLDTNTLPSSQKHKQNGHVIKKARYHKVEKIDIANFTRHA